MAASGKRAWKTNVFWTKDSDNQDEKIVKLHMPGVILEPHSNVKMPMVRKPVHMIKPRVVTLQKSLHNSLERRHGLKEESFSPSLKRNVVGTIPLSSQHEKNFGERHRKEQEKSKKQLSLKELNPQDKKRVANLVKELAKVGEERVHAEERLQVERTAFEERLAILQEEYDAVIKEKHHLQKRFVELQALLVKYQTNGRTPSPRKPVNSPPNKEEEKHQVWGVLSSASPSKPPDLSSSKSEPAKVTGNTRPSDTEHASDKFRSPTRLPLHVTPQVRNNDSVLLNNDNKRQLGKTSSKGSPLYHSSVSLGHARESIPGKSNLSQAGQIAAGASSEHLPLPIPTTAEEVSPSRGQSLEIPQSSCPKEEPNSHSLNPHETSTSSFVTAHRHPPSAVIPQPAMHPGPAVMSQYPPQAKPVFSVFGDGVSEPRIPPRKNEDRSFSETSGVSGSFSAELDAVYRLYCREYELQLQLQQQQIELQKQQLQLQQQLQQVEALQQQQQQKQQQQQQQQQQSSGKSPNYVPAATQAMARADHEKHLKTVVEETPAPSPVPRPSSQPRQVSPARSLIPTPEGSSSILSNGRLLPKTDLQTPRTESTVGSYVSRDQAPPEAEVSGTLPLRSRKNRMEPEKENRNPLVSDPHGRVMSAPPSLGHSRSNFERYQMHRHREEFSVPAVYSNDERVISGCGRNSMAHDPQTSGNMDGRVSADYHASGLLSSSYSLHSRSRDVSDIRENASLGERKGQDFCVEPDMLSGKASDDLFYSSSNYESNIDRASSTAKRFQTGSFLNGARISNAQPPFPEPRSLHPQMQGSFDRQNVGSDQRFSLYSDVQSRDDMFPDGDVRTYGPRMVEKSQDREPLDSAYPLSLVDIVDGLENETEKHTAPCRDPGKAEGLDTSDSGYSQDTYKERSPLTSESVNTDEEEAAVLEDIFFLTARF